MDQFNQSDLFLWGIALLLIYIVLRFGFPEDRGKEGDLLQKILKFALGGVLLYHLVACNPIPPDQSPKLHYTKRMKRLAEKEKRYHEKFLEATNRNDYKAALKFDRKAVRVGEELEQLLDHQIDHQRNKE